MKIEKWVIGVIAHCQDCEWKNEGYKTARKRSSKHARKFGHLVRCEVTYVLDYDGRPQEGK